MRLIYFPVNAKAEVAKMMAAYGGIPLQQVSCQDFFGVSSWKEAKSLAPFGQLPILELDDKRLLCQSGAIDRYIAKLCKLMPEDAYESALVDSYYEAAEELNAINPIVNVFRGQDFKEKQENFFTNIFPQRIVNLNKVLGKGPYMGERDTISHADFNLHHHLYNAMQVDSTCLDAYADMQSYFDRVSNVNEGVKNYLATRPIPIDVGVKPMLQAQETPRK